MCLHNKRMMYDVRVDQPDARFAKMLLEQFGGANGELTAALRYFTRGWSESGPRRRSILLDIATEELSHLEMGAPTWVMLLKGSASDLVDQAEGAGLRLTDSMGAPWTAAYSDTVGEPAAGLRPDIAAEARAKMTYQRLINCTEDAGVKDTPNFLMSREVAHQQMFEAVFASSSENFPPGRLQGNLTFSRAYVSDSGDFGRDRGAGSDVGYDLARVKSSWGFELNTQPVEKSSDLNPL